MKHQILGVKGLTPRRDQDRISPYNMDITSSRLVMRIDKNIK